MLAKLDLRVEMTWRVTRVLDSDSEDNISCKISKEMIFPKSVI
jgi:hypothetical protein